MTKNCKTLIDAYVEWLRKKTSVREVNGSYEITTPFLDRHNDYLQVYMKESNKGIVLTDDGHTIADLELSGYEFTSESRLKISKVLSGLGVNLKEGELVVEVTPENFPQKMHDLVRAMLYLNYLLLQ